MVASTKALCQHNVDEEEDEGWKREMVG